MPAAIILIGCDVGREGDVADELCRLPGVEEVSIVYGVYDLVVKLSSATMEELEALIILKVRSLPGIRSTITLIVSKECPV